MALPFWPKGSPAKQAQITVKSRQGTAVLRLGGSGEIGMNVNLYGCDGKWLMVDLGMTFSGHEYPGVDLVFADLEFIEERTR
jgi:mRNA degradation ribonuclease J1/J2